MKITDEYLLNWMEERHWDILFTTTLNKPRWVIGNRDNDDEIAEGDTLREAITNAIRQEGSKR